MIGFDELRRANVLRATREIFGHSLEDWSPVEWAVAIAGETGEMCNLVKKEHRGDEVDQAEIGKEIADIVIYCDLMAARYGFDLGELVRGKFNEVSDRVGCDIKIQE